LQYVICVVCFGRDIHYKAIQHFQVCIKSGQQLCEISERSLSCFRRMLHRPVTSRGVTRLDGDRGKKQVWRSHIWT